MTALWITLTIVFVLALLWYGLQYYASLFIIAVYESIPHVFSSIDEIVVRLMEREKSDYRLKLIPYKNDDIRMLLDLFVQHEMAEMESSRTVERKRDYILIREHLRWRKKVGGKPRKKPPLFFGTWRPAFAPT